MCFQLTKVRRKNPEIRKCRKAEFLCKDAFKSNFYRYYTIKLRPHFTSVKRLKKIHVKFFEIRKSKLTKIWHFERTVSTYYIGDLSFFQILASRAGHANHHYFLEPRGSKTRHESIHIKSGK